MSDTTSLNSTAWLISGVKLATSSVRHKTIVQAGPLRYLWREHWVRTPETPSSQENGRTHGAAVTADGIVHIFHQAGPAMLDFSAGGEFVGAWGQDFPGAHGMDLVREGGLEYFWLTDQRNAAVVKTTPQGEIVQRIDRPEIEAYEAGKYSPTWATSDPESGLIFVADGYGSSLVHRFDREGGYLGTLTGEEGAGRFRCPHGIFIDRRKATPELLIADRGNHLVQVYDLQGNFLRAWGSDELTSPCCFATSGEYLFIPELFARLAVFDGQDKLVGYLGSNEDTVKIEGWPNHPAQLTEAGKFNSPHGIAAGPDGSIYVVEWIVGGRVIRLEPAGLATQ